MNSQNILYIFIALVIFNFLFTTVLDYLNDKNWKDEIPDDLKDFYDSGTYLKAKRYKIERGRLTSISSFLNLIFTLLMLYFYGYGFISDYAISLSDSVIVQSSVFFMIFYLITYILGIPFSYYSTFVIEEKFGFNKTDLKTFVIDKIKSLIMSVIFIIGLTSIAVLIIRFFSAGFWLWLWIGLSLFMLFLNMFYADLIVPIFNKLTPLEEGDLRKKIEAYSKKVGYSLKNIFVIDGSKRSSKANAFFSGLGPRKTIALFDTLIEKHTDEELVSVLAHEVGHYKKKHVISGTILGILETGMMLFIFNFFTSDQALFNVFGVENVSIYCGLVLFGMLYSPVSLITSIFTTALSRKNEFEADAYALETTKKPEPLISMLKGLAASNLSHLTPHPLMVFLSYSHPPVSQRINAVKNS